MKGFFTKRDFKKIYFQVLPAFRRRTFPKAAEPDYNCPKSESFLSFRFTSPIVCICMEKWMIGPVICNVARLEALNALRNSQAPIKLALFQLFPLSISNGFPYTPLSSPLDAISHAILLSIARNRSGIKLPVILQSGVCQSHVKEASFMSHVCTPNQLQKAVWERKWLVIVCIQC